MRSMSTFSPKHIIMSESWTIPSTDHIISTIRDKLAVYGIDLDTYPIDHICYRCESDAHYQSMHHTLYTIADLAYESMIHGRGVSIWKCHQAIIGPHYTIPYIELAAPKIGNQHLNGREHIEVVVNDLDSFYQTYRQYITETKGYHKYINRDLEIEFPNLNSNGGQYAIKFHEQSIATIIAQEQQSTHSHTTHHNI